ncbi:MAG TPA: type II secretion system protein [Candidatus Paceibacterota bacterium]|nr:type II secretion system protein [Candidatus Paceibacterota bacterium]
MRKGFTLIEILIVVAIIAVLASVVLVGLGPTQQAGRDSRRVADLHEVQSGIELYYNKCGFYPGTAACGPTVAESYATMAAALQGAAIGVNSYPQDPAGGTVSYYYGENGTATAGGTQYIVGATLENASGTAFKSYAAPSNYAAAWFASGNVPPHACAAPDFCLTI